MWKGKERSKFGGWEGAGHPLTVPGNASASGKDGGGTTVMGAGKRPLVGGGSCVETRRPALVYRQEGFGLDE